MRFHRYHALGNDYLVLDPSDWPTRPDVETTRRICHRHLGVGSDGILYGPLPGRGGAAFALVILNPDGSEAEKSGNGLRIFCRYLFDCGRVESDVGFRVATAGGTIAAWVHGEGREVTVEMGQVRFSSSEIPLAGPQREALAETLTVDGRNLTVSCATIGNPHCVIDWPDASDEEVQHFGPLIERHALFPKRTNVQFLRVVDRGRIAIRIWERGAGATLASGSSACAAAAVAHRLGRVDRDVIVSMPGGELAITIGDNHAVTMRGPVTAIARGTIHPDMLTYR